MAVRNVIQRENINPNSLFIRHAFRTPYYIPAVFASELSISPPISLSAGMVLKIKAGGVKIFTTCLPKCLIVISKHCHICIVIPRNKASMTHCAKDSSGNNDIGDICKLTDTPHLA